MLEICNKCRGLLSKWVLFLRHNLRPHSSTAATEGTRQLKFELPPHPPCIPDLTLFDYHTFEPLKEALHGQRFSSDDEIKDVADEWLQSEPKNFLCGWDQTVCEPLHNMCSKKGRIC